MKARVRGVRRTISSFAMQATIEALETVRVPAGVVLRGADS